HWADRRSQDPDPRRRRKAQQCNPGKKRSSHAQDATSRRGVREPDLERAQLLARVVAGGAPLTPLEDKSGVQQATEVGAGGGGGHIRLSAVARPGSTANEALLERDHDPLGPAAALDELFQESPPGSRLLDLRKAPTRLSK